MQRKGQALPAAFVCDLRRDLRGRTGADFRYRFDGGFDRSAGKGDRYPADPPSPLWGFGCFCGWSLPITPSGIVAVTVSEENGISGVAMPLFWRMALTNVLYAVILYFFVFRWHKHKNTESAEKDKSQEAIAPFQPKQIATLAGIVLVAVLSTVFNINVGLASFAVAVLLSVFRAADESAALKKVPWNTLVMITGVGILISLVTELGGIDLLSTGLSALMGKHTAGAIITALAGVMSWVSSASGVVMPTLIPTVPSLVESLQNVNALELVIGICVGAHFAALSPLSSCGALTLAAYSSSGDVSAKQRNRMFSQLFLLSACGVVFAAVCALVGLYR